MRKFWLEGSENNIYKFRKRKEIIIKEIKKYFTFRPSFACLTVKLGQIVPALARGTISIQKFKEKKFKMIEFNYNLLNEEFFVFFNF